MKQRFSSLDVRVIAHELSNSLVSLRLSNVYDLSSRIFLLKFAKPDKREQLIIDSGFRCHLTSFARATAATPSPFVARLRKFLRTRRVTAVEQIGTDRVLEIRFSDGAYRLFFEFYAGGNIILTDAELTILALLRTVNEGAEHEQYRQGLKYDLSQRQNYGGVPELTKERLKAGLERAVEKQQEEANKPGKKIKKKPGDALRKALAVTTTEFPPILIDHALHVTSFDRTLQPEQVIESDELLTKLLGALSEAQRVIEDITSKETAKGYILAKQSKSSKGADASAGEGEGQSLVYDDFHAFKPAQLAEDQSIVFLEREGFNSTVDDFFSSIEGQKLESRLQEREDNAKRKIEQARQEQAKRIDGLQQVQELNIRKAQAIEANVERVEEAVAAVNGLIAQGMDWVDIGRLIENEQSRHNPVAEMIKLPLKLQENTVTLLLSELDGVEDEEFANETDSEQDDSDEEAGPALHRNAQADDKRLSIDIDLALSAWSNARQYYDQKRTAATKQEKTALAAQKALKSTEQKVMADLKKGLKQEKDILRPVRKQFWFEKFIYFISSDGYLVLAGRDTQQAEILYRRFLKKGDVYIHADLDGAASVIVKNNPATPDAPIPPSTLSQAGSLAVCTSSAWDSKAVMSAWWVNADQVSKTAPTGEYLTAGGFVVRGKKNFLPPVQLLLGFAVVFQISDESKANHVKHRLQNTGSRPETPELTDGETIAESSIAGDADRGEDESDDDFPDADAGPAPRAEGENQAATNDAEREVSVSNDEFPDASHDDRHDDDRDHEDDEDNNYRHQNPLQSSGNAEIAQHDEEDEESEDDENAEEDGNQHTAESLDEASTARQHDVDDTASTVTPGPSGGSEIAAEDNEMTGEDRQHDRPLTNKERKAQNRVENGKPAEQNAKPSKQHLKGKKGKARAKAAKYARYANQDEEDREIALKLLGSKDAKGKQESEAKAAPPKAETAEEARARRKAQHDRAQREGLQAEEMRRLALEDVVDGLDEDTAAVLSNLDSLVGTPLPGDEILEAIPVCAPWTALSKYKYKIKMQPGQQKKGKAVREILGKWIKDGSDTKKIDHQSQDTERIWPREAELIKGWKDAEVVGIIPVKQVRVMMSGGSADKGKGGRGGKSGRGGKGSKRR